MAKRNGQVVLNTLVTPDTRATFPVVDGNDIGGGRHIVQSLTDRNAIPAKHRKTGMLCYVETEDKDYKLLPGAATTGNTSDSDWTEYRAGMPAGVITSHQKAEDIVYADPVTSGYNKLIDKLAAMDAATAAKLSTHQTVEDIRYASTIGGFSTLSAKIADMDSKITAAAVVQNIEDISWKSAPANHPTALADELKNINDPTKIIITNTDGSSTNLQAKINALVASTPFVEDIKDKNNTPLTTLLANASDPTKIVVDKVAGTTLSAKLAAMDAATTAATQHVEEIDYKTATAEGYTHLSQKLADINNPDKIIVDSAAGTTLTSKLATLSAAASGALQNVEDISWKTTPSGHQTSLAAELMSLLKGVTDNATAISTATTDATAAKADAAKAQTDAATALSTANAAKTAADKAAADVATVTTTANDAKTAAATAAADAAQAKTDAATATTAATAAQTTANEAKTAATAAQTAATAATQNVEDISWKTTPSNHQTKLADELTAIVTKAADMNDPTKIMISTKTLTQVITELQTAQTNNVPPIYLLYNINSPAAGAEPCEYLTQYQSKLTEISFYTNADATIATDIVFALEFCGPTDTTYKTLAQGTYTLAASQSGKLVRTDLSGLATPIYLADNTRLRINIKSLGASDTIGSFNVRLTLQKDATTGVTTNVAAA